MERKVILPWERYMELLDSQGLKPSRVDQVISDENCTSITHVNGPSLERKPAKNTTPTKKTIINSVPAIETTGIDVVINKLPKKHKNRGKKLLTYIDKYPDVIDWDKSTLELIIHKKPLADSNIVKMISDAVTSATNKAKISPSIDSFYRSLVEINTPIQLVKNPKRRGQLLFLKYHSKPKSPKVKLNKTWIKYPYVV
jgi:hypothetical protein